MNKRGFGLVQVAIIIFMLIWTVIIFLFILFQPSPVNKEKTNEIKETYAAVVLDNLLALPVDTPPLGLRSLSPEPTIVDYLVFAKEDEQEALEIQMKDVLEIMTGTKWYYRFEWEDIDLVKDLDELDWENFYCAKDELLIAKRTIPRGDSESTITLSLCEVSLEKR